jgi:hypothetical protein
MDKFNTNIEKIRHVHYKDNLLIRMIIYEASKNSYVDTIVQLTLISLDLNLNNGQSLSKSTDNSLVNNGSSSSSSTKLEYLFSTNLETINCFNVREVDLVYDSKKTL